MSKQSPELNVIPLDFRLDERNFSFYRAKQDDENYAPLYDREIPEQLRDRYKTLYTDFDEHPDADLTLFISLDETPRFAKHYLNSRIYRWFKGKAYLRRKNFIKNNELYFRVKDESGLKGFAVFDRYVLRATVGRVTGRTELTIMYRGTMKVWKKSVLDYPGRPEDFSKVVYRKNLYRYKRFAEEKPGADRTEVFPVLNRQIAETLDLPAPEWEKINKLKRHTGKIYSFYKKWIRHPGFVKEFSPDPDGFLKLEEGDYRAVPSEAAMLRFGTNIENRDPFEGMKNGGPFRAPKAANVELFFIVSEEDAEQAGNRLYTVLKNGLGHFKGLKQFARIPVYVSDHNLTFQNSENPLPEVNEKLRAMEFRRDVQYGAIYISPIRKNDPDPRKQRVYYRIKEELLKYDVTSQVIYRGSVFDSQFKYYLPNIATALVAKLGGTPWTLAQQTEKELVIGIGAYRPSGLNKTYLGSAFCFSNNGDFKGFESFTSDDMLMLAGSFQRAIREFREAYTDIERVVLHYYKKINREEAAVLKAALGEMKLDIPMVILTIHKSGSDDLVIADMATDHRLPKSGIFYRCGRRQYLLCNNTRFGESGEKIRSYPFPVKVYFAIAGEEDVADYMEDARWVGQLLEQVYQFSRLNWQTVSVKEMPVTIAYPEMVAEKFPYFDGDLIPEFGKRNFWFL